MFQMATGSWFPNKTLLQFDLILLQITFSSHNNVYINTNWTSHWPNTFPILDKTAVNTRNGLQPFRIKKERNNKEQYTAGDTVQAQSGLIRVSPENVFHSVTHLLRRGCKLDSKRIIRSLYQYLDKN